MSISRVIEVSFGGGSIAYAKVDTAYFYNNGILFKPTDLDLPASYQVHWADSPDKATTIETIGTSDGAPIPDDLWDRSRVIYGWIYLHPTNDSAVTAYEVRIYKNARAGLPDGTEPTPAEQSTIDQLISALNSAVEQTGEDVESAEQAKDDAESARDNAQTYANNAQSSAQASARSAESASESARVATEKATASAESASASAQIKADVEDLADDAQASANASAQSASQASASEQGCARAVLDAASAAAIARARADEASGYAQTASAKAQNASQSASTASQKATESAQSASQALSYKTDAESAKTASQTAQGLAESARDSAVSAKTDAESARDDAETARDKAQQAVASISDALAEKAPVITDTASGAIASFSDGADNLPLKSLVVDINPVQDLHGYNSPWPAGGGKNLFNWNRTEGTPNPTTASPSTSPRVMDTEHYFAGITRNNYYGITPVRAYSVANGIISVTTTSGGFGLGFPVEIEENTDYVVSYVNINNGKVSVGYYDEDWNYLDNKDTYSAPYTFNAPVSSKYAVFVVTPATIVAGQDNECTVKDVQVELGSTATSWSPYENLCPISGWTEVNVNHSDADMTNPTTITIPLGQTVYGGKLDVLSGELTVYPYYASYNGETLTGEWISDRDKYVSGTTPTIGAQVVNIGAQGVTVQLEPHEVESLYGVNNLWADSGDTTAEYRADTKLFIERLTAPDSEDMVADANITSEQYFMVGNSLFKATANIANGAQIIVGTNAVRKSLSEALNEINA